MRLLVAGLLLLAVFALGEETTPPPATDPSSSGEKSERGGAHEHPHVTVRLWPRSQWDPEHQYRTARVVATMAVRICETSGASGTCAQYHDAWSTAVSRDDYIDPRIDRLVQTLERVYHFADLEDPHLCELYRTYDNMTYVEIPLALDENLAVYGRIAPLHPEDDTLLRKARAYAQLHSDADKSVLRMERGRLWDVPARHWNIGERGLNGEHQYLKTEWIGEGEADGGGRPNDQTTNTDERPVYYERQ